MKQVLPTARQRTRRMRRWFAAFILVLALAGPPNADAGLHLSREKFAELPCEWRGLLADLRLLRSAAVPTLPGQPASTLKTQYQEAVRDLRQRGDRLTADQAADLGALLLRLGQVDEALGQLRAAQAQHPDHFALTANLAVAWQLAGELRRALELQNEAVRLAPEALRPAEELHRRWLRLRLRETPGSEPLDDLFELAAGRPVPPAALANLQKLLLWFPAEGRLLWPVAEVAERLGDRPAAVELLEVAVGEFGVRSPALRQRRAELRARWLADQQRPLPNKADAQAAHAAHGATAIAFKSKRALVQQRFDVRTLPAVRQEGLNPLPWGLLLETALDSRQRPDFPSHLRNLDGLPVEMVGYMQPVGDDLETGLFVLVEYPVGCWYCELPAVTGLVCVEMKEGKTVQLTRTALKITGRLRLNRDDPEDFYFTIADAEAGVAD